MKSEIWPDVGMPEMTDWLAELRDDGGAEQPGDGHAAQAAVDDPVPEAPAPEVSELAPIPEVSGLAPIPEASALAPIPEAPAAAQANRPIPADQASGPAEAWPPGWAWTRASADTPAETSPSGWIKAPVGKHAAAKRADAPAKVTEPAAPEITEPAEIKGITERAVIGDELRRPITWCEMDSCISWYADPAALGEADVRARAISAGWRVDAFGRLACPQCQQTDPGFRVSHSVVLWDRRAAITGASRMAEARGNGTALGHAHDPRRPVSGHSAVGAPTPGRHRGRPATKSMPVGQQAR
jgi:hypothetical protein